ncbi:MAG: alpha/beta fold hydrolase [Alphaproteobacteria bacterium]|nr:alpha/beta fold hydrolase [Alphaproteobacteria bacterium]
MPFSRQDPKLFYLHEGSGPNLVLIHGVGSQHGDWEGVAKALAGKFSILRYDLRGHGTSAAPPGPYEIEDFAADLIALMDEIGLDRPHIAGFSLGGLIAQCIALNHPDRVDKLALLGTVAGRTPEERARVEGRLEFIASSHPADYFDQSVSRWFTEAFQAARPDVVAARKAVVTAMDGDAYAAAYYALAMTDFADRLGEISHETLVATGEDDIGSNPRMAHFMAGAITNSRLEILPGLRHSILLEAPDQVAGVLSDFFLETS